MALRDSCKMEQNWLMLKNGEEGLWDRINKKGKVGGICEAYLENEEYDSFTMLIICHSNSESLIQSSDLFTLIAKKKNRTRVLPFFLRFMACRKWSFNGTIPVSSSTNYKGCSRPGYPLSWLTLKGQCSLFYTKSG